MDTDRFGKEKRKFLSHKRTFLSHKGKRRNVTTFDGRHSLNTHYITTLNAMTDDKHALTLYNADFFVGNLQIPSGHPCTLEFTVLPLQIPPDNLVRPSLLLVHIKKS